jgi:hypothetical protein
LLTRYQPFWPVSALQGQRQCEDHILRDMTRYSLDDRYRRFGGTYFLHLKVPLSWSRGSAFCRNVSQGLPYHKTCIPDHRTTGIFGDCKGSSSYLALKALFHILDGNSRSIGFSFFQWWYIGQTENMSQLNIKFKTHEPGKQNIYFSTYPPPTLIHLSYHFTSVSKPEA